MIDESPERLYDTSDMDIFESCRAEPPVLSGAGTPMDSSHHEPPVLSRIDTPLSDVPDAGGTFSDAEEDPDAEKIPQPPAGFTTVVDNPPVQPPENTVEELSGKLDPGYPADLGQGAHTIDSWVGTLLGLEAEQDPSPPQPPVRIATLRGNPPALQKRIKELWKELIAESSLTASERDEIGPWDDTPSEPESSDLERRAEEAEVQWRLKVDGPTHPRPRRQHEMDVRPPESDLRTASEAGLLLTERAVVKTYDDDPAEPRTVSEFPVGSRIPYIDPAGRAWMFEVQNDAEGKPQTSVRPANLDGTPLPPPTVADCEEFWNLGCGSNKRPFWMEASAFESDRIAMKAGLPIAHVERLKEMMKEDDPRREFRVQLRNRRRAPGESLDSVYQDVLRLTTLAYEGDEDRIYDLMLIDALLEAMEAPALEDPSASEDAEAEMTRRRQEWKETDDWFERYRRDNPPCEDCELTLRRRGTRCDSCKGVRNEKFVLQGESDSPAEEN